MMQKRMYSSLVMTTLASYAMGAADGVEKKDNRPNILVVLVDDMGFSDLGCMGGEIQTPHIDGLAESGVRFNQFYNCGRSCPTRASLLTGLYPHKAGVGRMAKRTEFSGYEGSIKKEAATVAELLKDAGYNTGMVGKWHISATEEIPEHREWLANRLKHDPYVALDTYPTARGFQDFYGVVWGVVNYFNPFSMADGTTPVTDFPEDYYITHALTDTTVNYVRRYAGQDKPFFIYLAHTAPHWPLHALPEDIEKYKDTYKAGWEAIRNARYERMKKIGLFEGRDNYLSARQFKNIWEENPAQEWDARAMAVHAAMIDCVDQGIGKVLKALEETGELDNTLIFFMSDNGCSPESPQNMVPGKDDRPDMLKDGSPVAYPKKKEVLPGAANTMTGIGEVWANVANTPFRYWKSKMYEGGICTPLIVRWGKGLKIKKNSIVSTPGHVVDIMATCLDAAGVSYPESYKGMKTPELDGQSLLPVLKKGERVNRALYFEHMGEKAIQTADGWKAVCPANSQKWELYNLNEDRTELNNVALENQGRLKRMSDDFEAWANRSLVYPAPGSGKQKPAAGRG